MTDSCALEVAQRGQLDCRDVGDKMNLSRERVRQIEAIAVRKLKKGVE